MMCRNGCNHSPPSRLRDLLLAIAIFLAVLPIAGLSVYRRLHRQIERTQQSWPTYSTNQPPSAENSPTPALTATPLPAIVDSAPTSNTYLALGSLATLAFFSFWYWTLLKAQSLHPAPAAIPTTTPPTVARPFRTLASTT